MTIHEVVRCTATTHPALLAPPTLAMKLT